MKKQLFVYGLIFGFFILGACEHKNTSQTTKPLLEIKSYSCASDTSQKYHAYFPSNYDGIKKLPLLIIFDPHANGQQAVDSFRLAAEEFGFIVIGSDNSKNNEPATEYIIETLWSEVFKNYSVDPAMVFTGGFSGGGRVALMTALKTCKVKGVISSGSALAGINVTQLPCRLNWYGIAGLGDFNYNEFLQVEQSSKTNNFNYCIQKEDIGHAWPNRYMLRKALQWCVLQDQEYANENAKRIAQENYDVCKQLLSSDPYLASLEVQRNLLLLQGKTSTKKFIKLNKSIRKDDLFKQQLELEQQSLPFENALRKKIEDGLTTKNTEWWTNSIKQLHEADSNYNLFERNAMRRTLGYVGILCYSYANHYYNQQQWKELAHLLQIYEIVEPNNNDCKRFKELLAMELTKNNSSDLR